MLYWLCLFLVVVPLLFERVLLSRWRNAVPIRVHVHGTRGKTSTVQSLAGALRGRGYRVLAKTTGDLPQYILPDGSFQKVHRWGPARIQEQLGALRFAAHLGADIVVVEGMALQPETVFQSEQIIRATHAIVTNTRPDHQETMGVGRRGVLRTLSLMLPERGRLYTAREGGAATLGALAKAQGIPCSIVSAPMLKGQSAALAAVVAAEIGFHRSWRSDGVDDFDDRVPHEAGTFAGLATTLMAYGVTLRFYDLYSANDVASARLMWKAYAAQHKTDCLCVALLATRADRPLRTCAFMDWIGSESVFDLIAPVGDHAVYALVRGVIADSQIRNRLLAIACPWTGPRSVLERLCQLARRRGFSELTIVGFGNAHGFGLRWRRLMSRLEAA